MIGGAVSEICGQDKGNFRTPDRPAPKLSGLGRLVLQVATTSCLKNGGFWNSLLSPRNKDLFKEKEIGSPRETL
jgi:hypothetical protein